MSKQPPKLTDQQRKALHLGLRFIADALNEAGYPMQKVLKVDIDWDERAVKEYLWRPIQRAKTGKKSTTELDKLGEIEEVWETLMRALMEKGYIDEYVDFPSLQEGQADKDGRVSIDNYSSVR